MMDRRLMLVGDFMKTARVTLSMLYNYNKMGLLSPVARGENNYRYYSLSQLAEVNLIRTLQGLGMSLGEIKTLKDGRTPEHMADVLQDQIKTVHDKMEELVGAEHLIKTFLGSIRSVRDVDENAVVIQYLPETPVTFGEWNRYGEGEDEYDALVRFYRHIRKKYPDIDINYPVWGLFTKENVRMKMEGQRTFPERYYFYSPDGKDQRPAGLYAVGYTRGGYGQNNGLYIRMRDYIKDSGFEISGDAYEEYPLNEICIADDQNYLMRVTVTVRERGKQLA